MIRLIAYFLISFSLIGCAVPKPNVTLDQSGVLPPLAMKKVFFVYDIRIVNKLSGIASMMKSGYISDQKKVADQLKAYFDSKNIESEIYFTPEDEKIDIYKKPEDKFTHVIYLSIERANTTVMNNLNVYTFGTWVLDIYQSQGYGDQNPMQLGYKSKFMWRFQCGLQHSHAECVASLGNHLIEVLESKGYVGSQQRGKNG